MHKLLQMCMHLYRNCIVIHNIIVLASFSMQEWNWILCYATPNPHICQSFHIQISTEWGMDVCVCDCIIQDSRIRLSICKHSQLRPLFSRIYWSVVKSCCMYAIRTTTQLRPKCFIADWQSIIFWYWHSKQLRLRFFKCTHTYNFSYYSGTA